MKAIFWVAQKYGVNLVAGHVPRERNSLAEALSKGTSLSDAASRLTAEWERVGGQGTPPTVHHAPRFAVTTEGEVRVYHACFPPCMCSDSEGVPHPVREADW